MKISFNQCSAMLPLLHAALLVGCIMPVGCTKPSATNHPSAAEWMPTTVDERFSFQMPGEPKVQTQKRDTPAGEISTTFCELSLDNGARTYSFMTTELPSMLAEPKADEIEQRLEAAQQGALANSKGKLLKSEKIQIVGYAGRDCLIEIPGVGVGQMRVAWIRRTMVVMEVVNIDSKDTDRFFESLKLLKDSASPEPVKP